MNKLPTYGIVQKKKCRGSKMWYGWCRLNGKTTYISLKTENKKMAQEWKDRMNAARFFNGVTLWGMSTQRIDPDEAIENYLSQPNLAENTVKTYTGNLKNFSEWCKSVGVVDLGSLTREMAEEYVKHYIETWSAASVHRHVVAIKTTIKKAYQKAGIDRANPFEGLILPKKIKKERPVWNYEQIEKILDLAIKPKIRICWALMAYAGLRVHEALKFTLDDVHGDEFVVDGKGNKIATLPISPKLRAELDRYDGKFPLKMTAQTSTKHLHIALNQLGLNGTNHTFRHSFSSEVARKVPNPGILKKLARHSSVNTTLEYYVHVVDDDMKKAVQ